MTFNEALTGAKDINLESSLRSKYVELIIGMSLAMSIVYNIILLDCLPPSTVCGCQ